MNREQMVSEAEEFRVERFEITIAEEASEAFARDPNRYVTRILQDLGRFEVNSVKVGFSVEEIERGLDSFTGKKSCYHVVSPPAEKSNTICL